MLTRETQRSLLSIYSRINSSIRPSLLPRPRNSVRVHAVGQRRWIAPAPKSGETLMERRADRELPDINSVTFRWRRTLPIFLLIIAASSVAIFNYQKSSSSVVSSTLYALRTSPLARHHLGDEIYFAQRIPWISGQMNQLHGKINISFRVKGSKGEAQMRFASFRVGGAKGPFETTEWSLQLENGTVVDLLDQEGGDPFRALRGVQGEDFVAEEDEPSTRGFRQSSHKKQT